jgi:protein-tyrosine-phosphatase
MSYISIVKRLFISLLIISLITGCSNSGIKTYESEKRTTMMNSTDKKQPLLSGLEDYIENEALDFNTINSKRKKILDDLAIYIEKNLVSARSVDLVFICTHNSRRSHLSQLWALAASAYYDIVGVNTFSGGTEATAFNPRAVKALREAGFDIEKTDESSNPVYKVKYSTTEDAVKAFSKKFTDPFNPQENFIAVMTCSDADEACPYVPGASARFSVTYEDPKKADNTPEEEQRYNERCLQIATEMCYVFSKVNLS